ncbi:autotransporter outer membrane beta-barrel domain-containing protein, partial [Escherichia coli]
SGGTAKNTTIEAGGTLGVLDGGKATGVEQQEGAILIATTDKDTVVSGENTLGEFSIENGQAENVLLENGGQLTVVDGTSATGTTLRESGYQYVESGGTATGTIIENGGIQAVYFRGTADSTTVNNGGTQNVGGTATGT